MSKLDRPSNREHPFHTVGQIAERWLCSTKTIRRLIRSKKLIAHRVGNQFRVSHDDLRTYERTHRED